ncbi:hypothetical protein SAMN05428975_3166 [Mucilaginibacter sp. OK268]|nr:hypothetical protein SAMN05428975_3166 [Mucilaginibacter sp. OK268]
MAVDFSINRHFIFIQGASGVMLSSVEAWWVGLYARVFDGAQTDSPFNCDINFTKTSSFAHLKLAQLHS